VLNRRYFISLAAGLAGLPSAARAVARPPALRRLRLANANTGETFEGTYRNESGPIATVIDELCVFLRDHHSGEKTQMDVGVIDFLADVLDAVGATRATILSAYRTPETNAMLARTTFGVAENSQHIYGRALDVRLDAKLVDAMNAARSMQRGGVGWYPHSGFIHIDTGPVRNWTLDQTGLENLLLFDGGHLRLDSRGGLLVSHPGRPLTVGDRLALQRQLARAEFLARTHLNR
jgi:uncharacterized protein YcbK (DUF882 family)